MLLAGCTRPLAVPDAGAEVACFDDKDCPDRTLFFCNTVTSVCEPGCKAKSDCTAAVRKQFALTHCAAPLGCECDLGRCAAAVCASDLDCGPAEACRDGACVAAPDVSTVARCAVVPDFVVLRQGARAKFSVSAWDAQNAPVVPKSGATWAAVGPAVTGPALGVGLSAEFTGASPTPAAAQAVRATVGPSACFARVLVLPDVAPAADALEVLVTDELTGRPISSAAVLVSVPSTGAALGPAVATGATGLVTLPGLTGQPSVTVTVFHADYDYVTVANYRLTGSRVLSVVLRRNPLDRLGGYRGTVKNVPLTSNFHFGLAGTSLPGLVTDLSLTDLSFASIVGRSVPTRFKIGTTIDDPNVPLPLGLFVGFTSGSIKGQVTALGLAGTCLDANGAADEAAIATGTCGTRTAWAFTGDVPLGELPIDQFSAGFASVNFLDFFKRIRPGFWRFHSSIVRDVQFTLAQAPQPPDGGVAFTDADGGMLAFARVDHSFSPGPVPVALDLSVQVPDLPKFKNSYLDTALVFGGALAPGRGFVPLGMGVADNKAPADAKTDAQSVPQTPGLVSLRSAPPHHGLEGSGYGVIALAARSTPDVSAGLATSAIFARVPDRALKFDQLGAHPLVLGTDFPAVPGAARYNYLDVAALSPARTFEFLSPPAADPLGSVTQVVFTDQAAHAWVVVLDPAATGFTLPKPTGTFPDRTFFTGMTAGPRSPFFVRQLRLNDDPGSANGARISFDALVELNSTNADRLAEFVTGFSLLDLQRPSVAWTIPMAPGLTVPKGSAVVVTVRNFKVGTDGVVRLRFSPQAAGCPDAVGATDTSNGKGEIVLTIPSTCVLPNAELTAALVTPAGDEVLPPVSSVQRANIQ